VTPASVLGLGLWAPGFPDPRAVDGAPAPDVHEPPAPLLSGALRRRAGRLSRIAAEVVGQAARAGGADLAATRAVYGSVWGELTAAVEMMRSFPQGEGLPSPTTFHNSVHNTPAGYVSISAGSHAFAAALSAGPETSAVALLEALCRLDEAGGDVLMVLLDEPVPEPFGGANAFLPAGVALHLRAGRHDGALAFLRDLAPGAGEPLPLPRGLDAHPCRGGFALAAGVVRRHRGLVSLGGGATRWRVHLESAGA
jgi:hypothetical protein